MKNVTQDWLQYIRPDHIKIKSFHPKYARVILPISSTKQDDTKLTDNFCTMIWKESEKLGCEETDEMVIGFEIIRNDLRVKLFVGWYDNNKRIGLSCNEMSSLTNTLNQYFD